MDQHDNSCCCDDCLALENIEHIFDAITLSEDDMSCIEEDYNIENTELNNLI